MLDVVYYQLVLPELMVSLNAVRLVACLTPDGVEMARGLVNYNAAEAQKVMRKSSDLIESMLGYVDEPELIHRDNLVVL